MKRNFGLLVTSVPFLASLYVACSGLVAACGGEAPPPAAPPRPAPPSVTVTDTPTKFVARSPLVEPPPSPGVDRAAMDTNVSPCDDFYRYACGNWIRTTQIPSDEASWMRSFSVIRQKNELLLKELLEGLAKKATTPEEKKLGDFYASCVDEAAIEKAGIKPILPYLTAIDGIKDEASLARVIGQLEKDGINTLVSFGAGQDLLDATKVVGMVSQSGLGMPEREYYLDDAARMKDLRAAYLKHVEAMFKLAGQPASVQGAAADAKSVLEIETAVAKAWMSKEDRREPKKMAHPAKRADLAKLAPSFPWDPYLTAAGAAKVQDFNVSQPAYVEAAGTMMKTPNAALKAYLKWHVLRANGSLLPKAFVDERQSWAQTLMGTKSLPERWKRCVRTVDANMGEALAKPFVKTTLGAEGKANVVGMVQEIERAMHANLETLEWMDAPTRQAAFEKLGKIANKIAYPEKWRDYSKLSVTHDYLGNVRRGAAFEHLRQLSKIGQPVDRAEWQMSPPTVNAYYDPQLNEMVFPAGILQPPFYANAAPTTTNYGAIGMVMGHELTHGFDDEGRQFDAVGNLRDWWAPAVGAEFDRRASCVEKQASETKVGDGLAINGKLTLGENIADLGGIKLAQRALRAVLAKTAKAPLTPEQMKAADQELFLGYAQSWCGSLRDEALRVLVATNPHSPPSFRVNGPLSNLPEMAEAFGCSEGQPMVRSKKDRCSIW